MATPKKPVTKKVADEDNDDLDDDIKPGKKVADDDDDFDDNTPLDDDLGRFDSFDPYDEEDDD